MVVKRALAIALTAFMAVTTVNTGGVRAYASGTNLDEIIISDTDEAVAETESEDIIVDGLLDLTEDETVEEEIIVDEEVGASDDSVSYDVWEETEEAEDPAIEEPLQVDSSRLVLDANGGKFPDGETKYDTYIRAWLQDKECVPSRDDKAFCGWYADQKCTKLLSSDYSFYELKEEPAGGTTIYAGWSDYYPVTLVYGNETGTDPVKDTGLLWDYKNEKKVKKITLKVAKGYALDTVYDIDSYISYYIYNTNYEYATDEYWYSDVDRKNKVDNIGLYKPEGPATFYVGFSKQYHVLTVHAGDGGYYKYEGYAREYALGKYDTYYVPIDYSFIVNDTFDVDQFYLSGSTGPLNEDVRKTIVGFYLDKDFKKELVFEGGHATLKKDETDIYLKWEITKNSVTFDANGGDEAYIRNYNQATQEYEYVKTASFINEGTGWYDPGYVNSKDHHWKFLGWSRDPKATSAEFTTWASDVHLTISEEDSKKDIIFYAVWDKDAYFIASLDAGEGCTIEYYEDGTWIKDRYYSAQIEKNKEDDGGAYGYFGNNSYVPVYKDDTKLFSEWCVNGKGIGNVSYRMTEDTKFTASYATPYKVELYANGKEDKGGYFLDYDENKVKSLTFFATENIGMDVPEPKNDGGYTFDRWYEDPENTIFADVNYSYFYPTGDIKLYANWLKNCKITFDPGTGTIQGDANYTVPEGKTLGYWFEVPVATPAKDSDVFVAWYTDPKFTEESRVKTGDIKDYIIKDNTTFYAKYSTACDVTFDVGTDGAFVSKEGTKWIAKVPKGETLGSWVPTVKSTKMKAFAGWFTAATGGEELTNLYEYEVTGTTTLYAHYAESYKIVFEAGMKGAKLDGSEEPVTVLVAKGKAYGRINGEFFNSNAPELTYEGVDTGKKIPRKSYGKSGYLGWTISGDKSGDVYFFTGDSVYCIDTQGETRTFYARGFVPTGDMTFQVAWADPVTVTFDAGDYKFDEKLKNDDHYGKLSDDGNKLVQTIPKGSRFSDLMTPVTSHIANPPAKKRCSFKFDSKGKEINYKTPINNDLTVTAKWFDEEVTPDDPDQKTIKLHSGKGYFGSKDYPSQVETLEYGTDRTIIWTTIPNIDDPDKAFSGWLNKDGTPYAGKQNYSNGSYSIEVVGDFTDLYAGYGPTFTVGIDAGGGYFDDYYSMNSDPDENIRSNTYQEMKPEVSGYGFSLYNFSRGLRYDGDKVFAGWSVVGSDGKETKPVLTYTNLWKEVYVPKDNSRLVAKWTVSNPVDSLTLPATFTVKKGETKTISLTEKPKGAIKDQEVIWGIQTISDDSSSSKSDSSTISLDTNGNVTGLSKGKVYVYAECNGRRSNYSTVTVTDGTTPTKSITLDKTEVNLINNETAVLTAIVDESSDAKEVKWASSDEKIVSIEGEAKGQSVTVKAGDKEGTATVTATLGSLKATAAVTVSVPLKFDKYEATLTGYVGATTELKATVSDSYKDKGLEWSTTNKDVLTVTPDAKDYTKATLTVVSEVTEPTMVEVTAKIKGEDLAVSCGITINPVGIAAKPVADVPDGKVAKGTLVQITSETYGALIYYTEDGVTSPELDANGVPKVTDKTKPYTDAIVIDKDKTIKAIAYVDGFKASDVATFKYTVDKADWGDIEGESPALRAWLKSEFKDDSSNVDKGVWFILEEGITPDAAPFERFTQAGSTRAAYTYTGEEITFNDRIIVYDGTRRLIENRDYTLTWKNNTNATENGASFTVKGTGLYSSTATFTFGITQADITSAKITSELVVPVSTGTKLGATKPVVEFNGKVLKAGTDYEYTYKKVKDKKESEASATETIDKADGTTYLIGVTAKSGSNFKGSMGYKVTVKPYDKSDKTVVQAKNLKVTFKNSQGKNAKLGYKEDRTKADILKMFTAEGGELKATVFNGKTQLEYGKDFTVDLRDTDDGNFKAYKSVGKHNIVIVGKENKEGTVQVVGEKNATLEITGGSLKKVKIAGLSTTTEYTGEVITLADLFKADAVTTAENWKKVTLYTVESGSKKALVEGQDYVFTFSNTGVVGKTKLTFTGINGYKDEINKKVNIKTRKIQGSAFNATAKDTVFDKAGATTTVTVTFNNGKKVVELEEGIDYTVKYSNNKKVFVGSTDDKKAPTANIKGMGNFSGSKLSAKFKISKANASNIKVVAGDVTYNSKKSGKSSYFKVVPKLFDNGAKVSVGKNKDVEAIKKADCKYYYQVETKLEDGTTRAKDEEVQDKDKVPVGTAIVVKVPVVIKSTKSPYNADVTELVGTYRVIDKGRNISKYTVALTDSGNAKLTVSAGETVIFTKKDFTISYKEGGATKTLGEKDYEITSVTGNTGIGKATITFEGRGEFGGTKKFTVNLTTKKLK